MGLYRSGDAYTTQCEPEGFRRITYFPDRPDVMAVFTTRVEADKAEAPVLLANGNLTASGDIAGTNRHFARVGRPVPQALPICSRWSPAISAASRTFTTRSGRRIPLRIYTSSTTTSINAATP